MRVFHYTPPLRERLSQSFSVTPCLRCSMPVASRPPNKYREQLLSRIQIHPLRERIRAHVAEHRISIITGKAGCGKSTAIPYYLATEQSLISSSENRKKRIWVLQPTRLACQNVAGQSSVLFDSPIGDKVGLALSSDAQYSAHSEVIYATTGYAARYFFMHGMRSVVVSPTHIIFDEAHERSLDFDLLTMWLQNQEYDGRVIFISATLDAEYYSTRYFLNASAILNLDLSLPEGSSSIPSGFIVRTAFSDNCHFDWVSAPLLRILKSVNRTVPTLLEDDYTIGCRVIAEWAALHKGRTNSVLVFLPGHQEILMFQDFLRRVSKDQCANWKIQLLCKETLSSESDAEFSGDESEAVKECGENTVWLSTELGETSLTLANVGLVLDYGCHRVTQATGHCNGFAEKKLVLEWCSKSSILQRRGRVGRTQNGYVLHLFSEAFYCDLPDYGMAEHTRTSNRDIILQLVCMDPYWRRTSHLLKNCRLPPLALSSHAVQAALSDLKSSGIISVVISEKKNDEVDSIIQVSDIGMISHGLRLSIELSKLLHLSLRMGDPEIVVLALLTCALDTIATDIHDTPRNKNSQVRLYSKIGKTKERYLRGKAKIIGNCFSDNLLHVEIMRQWIRHQDPTFLKKYALSRVKILAIEQRLRHLLVRLCDVTRLHISSFDLLRKSILFPKRYPEAPSELYALLNLSSSALATFCTIYLCSLALNPHSILIGHSSYALRAVGNHQKIKSLLDVNDFDHNSAVCTYKTLGDITLQENELHALIVKRLPFCRETIVSKAGFFPKMKCFVVEFSSGAKHLETTHEKISCFKTKNFDASENKLVSQANDGVTYLNQLAVSRSLLFDTKTIKAEKIEKSLAKKSKLAQSLDLALNESNSMQVSLLQEQDKRLTVTGNTNVTDPETKCFTSAAAGNRTTTELEINKIEYLHQITWRSLSEANQTTISHRSLLGSVKKEKAPLEPILVFADKSVLLNNRKLVNSAHALPVSSTLIRLLAISCGGNISMLLNTSFSKARGVSITVGSRHVVLQLCLSSTEELAALMYQRKLYRENQNSEAIIQIMRNASRNLINCHHLKHIAQPYPGASKHRKMSESSINNDVFQWYDEASYTNCLSNIERSEYMKTGDIKHGDISEDKFVTVPDEMGASILHTLFDNITMQRAAEFLYTQFVPRLCCRILPGKASSQDTCTKMDLESTFVAHMKTIEEYLVNEFSRFYPLSSSESHISRNKRFSSDNRLKACESLFHYILDELQCTLYATDVPVKHAYEYADGQEDSLLCPEKSASARQSTDIDAHSKESSEATINNTGFTEYIVYCPVVLPSKIRLNLAKFQRSVLRYDI